MNIKDLFAIELLRAPATSRSAQSIENFDALFNQRMAENLERIRYQRYVAIQEQSNEPPKSSTLSCMFNSAKNVIAFYRFLYTGYLPETTQEPAKPILPPLEYDPFSEPSTAKINLESFAADQKKAFLQTINHFMIHLHELPLHQVAYLTEGSTANPAMLNPSIS